MKTRNLCSVCSAETIKAAPTSYPLTGFVTEGRCDRCGWPSMTAVCSVPDRDKKLYLIVTHVYELLPGIVAKVTRAQTEADVPYELYDMRTQHEASIRLTNYQCTISERNPLL